MTEFNRGDYPLVLMVLQQTNLIENTILEQYSTPRDPDQARIDAAILMSNSLGWHSLECLLPDTLPEELEMAQGFKTLYRRLLDAAEHGHWDHVKQHFQDYARECFEQSTGIKGIIDSRPDKEQEALFWTNLSRSL